MSYLGKPKAATGSSATHSGLPVCVVFQCLLERNREIYYCWCWHDGQGICCFSVANCLGIFNVPNEKGTDLT